MNFAKKIRPLRYWVEKKLWTKTYNSKELEKFKDIYYKVPLVVVGNGPSLKKTPLDNLKNIPSIGMNKINLLFPRVKWRPSIIVCQNRHVMNQNLSFFSETDIPVVMSWQARWFVSKQFRSKFIYYLSTDKKQFSKNIIYGVDIGGTVTYAALQFAYYMGADPVFLIGVDHSFAYKGKPNELVINQEEDSNHFDSNYFGKGVKWNNPDLDESERSYSRAKKAFEEDNRTVYDATIGGKLQIFPKVSFDYVIQKCHDHSISV